MELKKLHNQDLSSVLKKGAKLEAKKIDLADPLVQGRLDRLKEQYRAINARKIKNCMRYLVFILLFTTQSFAATYYVKLAGGTGTGLDSNAQAWSYAKFNSTPVPAGSTVLFRSGEKFYGTMQAWAGTSGNSNTYGTYGNSGNATFTGFTSLTTWTFSGTANIYYASLTAPSAGIEIVTVDGVMKPRGRYPSTGYLTYTSHSGNSSITGTTIGALPTNFSGGEVVIKKYRYILDRHTITGQSGNTITYTSPTSYGTAANYAPTDGNGYFIQNHIATLVIDGDWMHDPSTNRIYMKMTGGMSGHVIKAGNINSLVPFNSIGYATFNNINFEGANYAIEDNYSSQIIFNNCNVNQCGYGIYGIALNNLTWTNGTMSNLGSNGIFIEDTVSYNVTITNSLFQNTNVYPGMTSSGDGKGCGIALYANNLIITNNTVKNTGFNGIHFDGNNVLVYQNFVDSFNTVKDDGGGIYTYTLPPFTSGGVFHSGLRSNRIVRANVVTNAIGSPEGAGANGDAGSEAALFYMDGYSNHIILDSNFCENSGWMAIMINANSDHTITNNTTFNSKWGLLINQVATSGDGSVRNLLVSGNRFIGKTSTQLPFFINLMNVADNPSSFGTFTNNIYARPVDDNLTIQLSRNYSGGNGDNFYTVASWKTASGMDAGSLPSAITTASVSDIRSDNNPTSSTLPISLSAQYKDVSGTLYSSWLSLSPYRGSVLVYYAPSSGTINGGNIKINQSGLIKVTKLGKIIIAQEPPQIP